MRNFGSVHGVPEENDENFQIGDRVKVRDQQITGTVVRQDTGSKWVVLDDDYPEWADDEDDGTLVFRSSDLIPMEDSVPL